MRILTLETPSAFLGPNEMLESDESIDRRGHTYTVLVEDRYVTRKDVFWMDKTDGGGVMGAMRRDGVDLCRWVGKWAWLIEQVRLGNKFVVCVSISGLDVSESLTGTRKEE